MKSQSTYNLKTLEGITIYAEFHTTDEWSLIITILFDEIVFMLCEHDVLHVCCTELQTMNYVILQKHVKRHSDSTHTQHFHHHSSTKKNIIVILRFVYLFECIRVCGVTSVAFSSCSHQLKRIDFYCFNHNYRFIETNEHVWPLSLFRSFVHIQIHYSV